MKKSLKKLMAGCVALSLAVSLFAPASLYANAKTDISLKEYDEKITTYSVDGTTKGFNDYIASVPGREAKATIVMEAKDYVRYEEEENGEGVAKTPETKSDFEGMAGTSVLTTENSLIELEANVAEDGIYYISIQYYPIEGKSTEIQRSFLVDGLVPYNELALVNLERIWVNSVSEKYTDGNGIELIKWERDNQGNDVKPDSIEAPEWIDDFLYDSNGYITEPLAIYLTKGTHTFTVRAIREPMLLKSITLGPAKDVPTYEEYKNVHSSGSESKGKTIRIEAENSVKSSSQMLYPRQDQTGPAVYPVSPKALLNNSVGGGNWRLAGQWIEWEFEVEEAGFYNISAYVRQNFVRGLDTHRKISIDGEVPFEELKDYGFGYKQRWYNEVLSDKDGKPFNIYLDAGKHTIRMEVVLGDMAGIIAEVQGCVQDLNDVYRQVICLTGVSPDRYHDYQIESNLPNLGAYLVDIKTRLDDAIAKLRVTAGNNSDKLTVLLTMTDQLEELIKDNERFSEVISSYKVNVRACGNWITQVLDQSLQVDRITVSSPDVKVKIQKDIFFARLWFEIQRLFYSFIIDYNQIGNVIDKNDKSVTITLWIGTGRDQANVIKSLIDKDFTSSKGINVNVQLVDMNTLLRATLSGQGPDVAIQVANTNGIAGAVLNTGNDTPVNYGLRNAVLDLTQFPDFNEVCERFYSSALTGFSFNGATYALPDTQTFPMMFYRMDILEEIGLELPKTWEDVKVAMSVLNENQMEFGMLPSEQVFAMLLFQNGGEYYTEGGKASALSSDTAVNVFKQYCEYYTDYKLDKATSVEERFRTGECPIIIADYTVFNNLQVSAPDIKGLWNFTNVPGTVQEDGSVNISTGCSCLADIIMKDTDHPDECWEFLKWWTSAETQVSYGREMEALMGESARVATANKEALSMLSWTYKDYNVLKSQLENVVGIPQVPGGYYTWRNVNNAFYTVTTDTDTATPREELTEKVLYINAEINYKREEFNLPLAED